MRIPLSLEVWLLLLVDFSVSILLLSRCSKFMGQAGAYYTLTCLCIFFLSVCPAFIGRVARATLPLQPETDKNKAHIHIK